MDFLSALPIETWSEIVSHVAYPRGFRFIVTGLIVETEDWPDYGVEETAQRNLAKILTTCKGFFALVEPFLYRYVTIETQASYEGFLASADRLAVGGRRRGDFTVSISAWESEDRTPKMRVAPSAFLAACPNLIHLTVFALEGMEKLVWEEGEGKHLKHVALQHNILRWNDLVQLSIRSPSITELRIGHCVRDECNETICFPSLTHLRISAEFVLGFDILKFDLPALSHLYADADGGSILERFLQRNTHSIRHLDMSNTSYLDGDIMLPQEALSLCAELRSITLYLGNPWRTLDGERSKEYAKQFMALNLVMNNAASTSNMKECARFFSPTRFPTFTSVTFIILGESSFESGLNLYSLATKLFPSAKLGFKRA